MIHLVKYLYIHFLIYNIVSSSLNRVLLFNSIIIFDFSSLCQAHRNSIIYLVIIWRRSKKWKRKKELWKLINFRRLISFTNSFDIKHSILNLDHLIRRLTRDRDIIFFQFLIKQDFFDANCLNDERSLFNRFDVNKVSIDAKDRKFDHWYHFFFHFIQNILNDDLCLVYALLSLTVWIDQMRHQWYDQKLYAEKIRFWFVKIFLIIIDYISLCIVEIFDRIFFAIRWIFYSANLVL